ncbi:MAG TPA: hypothetical protein VGH76_25995 [Actinomycetospora sp.]|uniref:hypothetical protein n=1 Tax=Actinomycetospora sp. TaxID=1872135 RepID=UPI002F420528
MALAVVADISAVSDDHGVAPVRACVEREGQRVRRMLLAVATGAVGMMLVARLATMLTLAPVGFPEPWELDGPSSAVAPSGPAVPAVDGPVPAPAVAAVVTGLPAPPAASSSAVPAPSRAAGPTSSRPAPSPTASPAAGAAGSPASGSSSGARAAPAPAAVSSGSGSAGSDSAVARSSSAGSGSPGSSGAPLVHTCVGSLACLTVP